MSVGPVLVLNLGSVGMRLAFKFVTLLEIGLLLGVVNFFLADALDFLT
jgi:hypothetical protein